MPRIEFYTLEAHSPGDRYLLACRLIADLYREGQRVLVQCPDASAARQLDRLLWTFRQASFIPHGLRGQTDADLTPVLIGQGPLPAAAGEVLVNLTLTAPTGFEGYARICEPVDQDPAVRAAARERFRWYRDRGFPPEHHALTLTRADLDPT